MTASAQEKKKSFKFADNFFQNHVSFSASYFEFNKIPVDLDSREIAILGRSNVGKSTLINNLCLNKNLAFTSKRPGCTISVNFYKINQKIEKSQNSELFLVDLPGYGYAKKGNRDINKISNLVSDYIIKRRQLIIVYLLIDSRVGVQEADAQFINFFHKNDIPYQMVLTKIDKAKKTELEALENLLTSFFQNVASSCNKIFQVSAKEKINLGFLREDIINNFKSHENIENQQSLI